MKTLILTILLCNLSIAYAQEWPLKKLVTDKKASQVNFVRMPAFNMLANKTLAGRGIYQELRLDAAFTTQLLLQKPDAIQLILPLDNDQFITCELVNFSLGNIKFTENNSGIIDNVKIPLTYHGIVKDEQNRNNVMLTVNENYLSLQVSFRDKVYQVTKANEQNSAIYRLYNSTRVQFPQTPFECGTAKNMASHTSNGIDLTGVIASPAALQDKCVNVFVDCFDSLYQWRNSNRQQTIDYVYELFNSVATGYYNEQINIQITTINVWTTMDPYRGDNRDNALFDLAANWQDNFWGNICVGLDYSVSGPGRFGLAGGIGKIKAVSTNTCPVYNSADSTSACCYNDLDYSVSTQNFPTGPNTTGPQVYLVMHEIGHLLGARHTQWCGWKLTSNPDTFGAIDSCGTIEGNCMQGPPPPASGATIMSYCVSGTGAGNFANFNNGFGPLPGAAIRNFVEQSTCLLNCLDCFGWIHLSNKDNYAFHNYRLNKIFHKNGDHSKLPLPNNQPPETELMINSQKTKQ